MTTLLYIAVAVALLIGFVMLALLHLCGTGTKYKISYRINGEWHEEELTFWDDGTVTAYERAMLHASDKSSVYQVVEVV